MKLEQYNFYCSHCGGQLDNDGNIHLKTKRSTGDEGIMHLSTSFGTYTYKHDPDAEFGEDELVDFFCQFCSANIQSIEHPDYSSMTMRAESKFDFEILFSRKAGMHKTYIVTEDGVESYGEHADGKLD